MSIHGTSSVNSTMLKAGLYTAWGAGILTSFSTLYDLAVTYGGWISGLGILLPLSLDVYWLIALAVAMDGTRNRKARRKAAIHAAVALAASIAGNLLYHEIHAGDIKLHRASAAILVAMIGSEPVLAGAALAHLSILARPVPVPDAEETGVPDAPGTPVRGAGATERTAARRTGTPAPATVPPVVPQGVPASETVPVPGAAHLGTGTEMSGGTGGTGTGPDAADGKPAARRSFEDLVTETWTIMGDYQPAPGKKGITADELVLRLHVSKTTAVKVLQHIRGQAASGEHVA